MNLLASSIGWTRGHVRCLPSRESMHRLPYTAASDAKRPPSEGHPSGCILLTGAFFLRRYDLLVELDHPGD